MENPLIVIMLRTSKETELTEEQLTMKPNSIVDVQFQAKIVFLLESIIIYDIENPRRRHGKKWNQRSD